MINSIGKALRKMFHKQERNIETIVSRPEKEAPNKEPKYRKSRWVKFHQQRANQGVAIHTRHKLPKAVRPIAGVSAKV